MTRRLLPTLVLIPLAAGCHSKPTPVDILPDHDLRAIAADYRALVQALHQRPDESWHHDWTGNILPNTLGGRHKGLCFQWQAEVWAGIQPALARTRWRGTGLAANVDHWTEHHVVVVFDPARTSENLLLAKPTPIAWVLDPWHTGTPAVYTLRDWLLHGTSEWFSIALEPLPAPPQPPANPEPAAPVPPPSPLRHAPSPLPSPDVPPPLHTSDHRR